MGAAIEALATGAQGFRASMFRKPIVLARRDSRLSLDADTSARWLESLSEGRILFGKSQVHFFKVQAGIVVAAQRPEWGVRLTPSTASFWGRIFDGMEVAQTFEFSPTPSTGYVRKVLLRNSGVSGIRLRVVSISDPAAAHFRDRSYSWGSLGVNAFNRESHVAMDEISDPHPARVIGSFPAPGKIYMTADRSRAAALLQDGDLPEPTAGMSGQVLVLSLHEIELGPSETKELEFVCLYSPNKLEEVLTDFDRLQSGERAVPKKGADFSASSPKVTEVFGWACSALEGAQFEQDLLDRFDVLQGLVYVDPETVEKILSTARSLTLKDGSVGHSLDNTKPGALETSVLLSGASRYLQLVNDRKRARPLYTSLRKMANSLAARSVGGSLRLGPGIPQGWRRHIGSGYPSGEVPEVSLAAAAAFSDFARVSRLLGKGEDAAKFRERSELVADGVGKRMVDERGLIGLSVDPSGRIRAEETVDTAVACYRNPAVGPIASSAVHRTLENDFETGYGPRTVPTSNRMYFHSSYGHGQLGGYWTRAALANAVLSYAAGLAGIGSLALEKVCRLVTEDTLKLGGVPGEFPYWVDMEGREAHGDRSDPVAASRFIQAVVEGELGLTLSGRGPAFSPPTTSTIKWIMATDLWVGERVSMFVGRTGNRMRAFAACGRAEVEGGEKFGKSEVVESSHRSVHGVSFYEPGQVICLGNSSASPARAHIKFAPKASGLSKRLSTSLEELDPARGSWNKIGSLRVSADMAFDAAFGPGDWRVYRLSTD